MESLIYSRRKILPNFNFEEVQIAPKQNKSLRLFPLTQVKIKNNEKDLSVTQKTNEIRQNKAINLPKMIDFSQYINLKSENSQ